MSRRRAQPRRGMPACFFEQLPVAVTVTDRRGRIRAVNREARRLAGPWPRPGAETCRAYWGCVSGSECPLRRAVAGGRTLRHTLVRARGARGLETLVERVSPLRGKFRGALIVTGPATAHFRRLERLRREARVDALTGVLNRRRFDAVVALAARAERRRVPSAFLMLDVDGLKAVNDRHGHAAGDRLLQRLGALLARGTRRGDLVGRVGGDEFAVYCPATGAAEARRLVRRLRRAIALDNASHPGEPRLSAQFGAAIGRPRRRDGLRERADALMRRQKRRVMAGRR